MWINLSKDKSLHLLLWLGNGEQVVGLWNVSVNRSVTSKKLQMMKYEVEITWNRTHSHHSYKWTKKIPNLRHERERVGGALHLMKVAKIGIYHGWRYSEQLFQRPLINREGIKGKGKPLRRPSLYQLLCLPVNLQKILGR